jgi:cell division protein FtsN
LSKRGTSQFGGFAVGLVAGLLIGLALALGVAMYITKAPVPFINKVPQRAADHDSAEAERNRNWDPNAPLASRGRPPAPPAGPGGAVGAGGAPLPEGIAPAVPGAGPAMGGAGVDGPGAASPLPPLSTARGPEPFMFYVQAGAFTRSEDAEQQRARLAMLGQAARVTEREQAGRTVYRVRVGPFPTRDQADAVQTSLQDQSIQAQIVRVERN